LFLYRKGLIFLEKFRIFGEKSWYKLLQFCDKPFILDILVE